MNTYGPNEDEIEDGDENGEELESEDVLPEELEDLSDGEEIPSSSDANSDDE